MIKVGDRIPGGKLYETLEFESKTGCPLPPKEVDVETATRGKRIVVFAVPGAYTPTCSMQHLPGYLQHFDAFKARGVDEIWCVATNDAFVMAAWGREQGALGKLRMLADGSAIWTQAMGLGLDLTARGMGVRSQRYSMLIEDGVVKRLNVEAPGKFEVSNAETLLAQLG
ncbi:Peroxiredoxin [Fontimonas thermophila]|uniref:Glutathione-dependent peroxiredoxin n=1 Tax=Fontimonas thermophila TaxID=1076937 RepID=A0A1I2KEK8_9GAMM|nr:peroxiredoxin [Fontimonas thermophila]SFF64903.1 Peroxiredoxin [Fontimonas thermophila]